MFITVQFSGAITDGYKAESRRPVSTIVCILSNLLHNVDIYTRDPARCRKQQDL